MADDGNGDKPPSGSSLSGKKRKPSDAESIISSLGHCKFNAPYLGGKPTHFQRKVQQKVEALLQLDPPAEVAPKTATTIVSRRTGLQQNVQWRNDLAYKADTGDRYKSAYKEATKLFADIKNNVVESKLSQQEHIDNINKKWSLDGEGKEGSREKDILSLSTITRAVRQGNIGVSPQKKGKSTKISRDFTRLIAVHANMEQVGDRGELDASQMKATMIAATLGTVHEKEFNIDYAWETVRRENADIMIPTGVKQSEDIRWKWVTHEKLNLFFTDLKVSAIVYVYDMFVNRTISHTVLHIHLHVIRKGCTSQIWVCNR